ncbi:MAG: MerR family transcriptional regulator [Deltaproteobacteria bacterium]|nr:MerR family transcriptional regulator [Deltaproteobacteria bacterium]
MNGSTEETKGELSADYTIDELSAKTGVPSRTIRFYQAKGALQPPIKKGRVAYYGEEHVERLKVVATLQDRGLNLRAICDLANQINNRNLSVYEWLGLEERIQASWAEDEPKIMNESEIQEFAGSHFRPGLIADLEKIDRLRREGSKRPASFFVPSIGLLRISLKLEAGGVDLKTGKAASELMKRRLGKMADELIALFVQHFFPEGDVGQVDTQKLSRSIQTLREIWFESTRLLFAQEIERAIRESFERGDFLKKKRRRL